MQRLAPEELRFKVCRYYPWLVSELYELEGVMGWGFGFREHSGNDFPPPCPDAADRMRAFLELLAEVRQDDVLATLIKEASRSEKASRPSILALRRNLESQQEMADRLERRHQACVRLLSTAIEARTEYRSQMIRMLYDKIEDAYPLYVLGGAKLYLFQWQAKQRYALAASGLVWLLFNPITKRDVLAEAAQRKQRIT